MSQSASSPQPREAAAGGRVPISIITPTLNAAGYVTACLANVSGQRIARLEHLVVDGGSTDETRALVAATPGVEWLSRPGRSQTQAINDGLRHARGEIVAWLNADDLYVPDALRLVIERFDEDPALQMLYGDCEVIGDGDEPLWCERPGPYEYRRLLRRGNYLAQPAVFLRRNLFERIGYLDETLEYAMDYDLWLRARDQRPVYLPRALARFRWHAGSKTARAHLQAWREFLFIVRKHGGGWTPELMWAFARFLVTATRLHAESALLRRSRTMRPLTRGGRS